MASIVDICNLALTNLGANQITSLLDESVEARLCNLHYDFARDSVLEDREWTFAVSRAGPLAKDAGSPVYQYENRFLIPADVIRLIDVRDDRNTTGSPIGLGGWNESPNSLQWAKEGNYILCNSEMVYIKYIRRVEDPNEFSSAFSHALGARLAAELAVPITESRALLNDMMSLYDVKIAAAAATDGMQGRTQVVRSSRLINSRGRQ